MSTFHIYIELDTRSLILKNDQEIFNRYPVAIGKPSTPTPVGNFQVLNMIKNPGDVLGTRWMQFTHRIHGIHGTNQPWLIGQAISNGCVRMYNRDVEQVYSRVSVGTPVTVGHSFKSKRKNGAASFFIYTVKKGDSLWKISRRYNSSITEIRVLNNIKGDLIFPGQQLKIPTYQA
jgi:hypothetical protein